jgi:nucleoside-diphosphate-sugar epimerase
MHNILITGGSGFIGQALVHNFLNKNYFVINFDLNDNIKVNSQNYLFFKGDIKDKSQLKKVFNLKKISSVIHLAYINGTDKFYKIPVKILEVAALGIINICNIMKDNKIGSLYLASSSEVYNDPLRVPTKEDEMLKVANIFNPRFSYGGGKIFAELYSQNFFFEKYLDRLIIFRPHNIYGKEMAYGHVIPQFCNRIMSQKKNIILNIQGTGREVRSFMHINDFVDAFNLIFFSKSKNDIYNIGNNSPVTILDLINSISKILNKKILVKKNKILEGSPVIRVPDNSKIKKLGYKQKINLERGLIEMLEREKESTINVI